LCEEEKNNRVTKYFQRTAALANEVIGEFKNKMEVIMEPALSPNTVTY
jgi:hypothetical protein